MSEIHCANTISISVYQQNDNMNIYYQDNGIGLDEASLANLFEPFYTTKRSTDCTGFGMLIVFNKITHSLHGTIEVNKDYHDVLGLIITLPLHVE